MLCHYAECLYAKGRHAEYHMYAECHYAECRVLFMIMMSVFVLNAVIQSVVMPKSGCLVKIYL